MQMLDQEHIHDCSKAYVPWLTLLYGLFLVRVLAQLTQKFHPIAVLPPFDAWQSGAVPYGMLLASQITIILVAGWALLLLAEGRQRPSRRFGHFMLAFGATYFAVMSVRLAVSLTFAESGSWWDATLPTVFHLVLASFALLLGHFHIGGRTQP